MYILMLHYDRLIITLQTMALRETSDDKVLYCWMFPL